MVKRNFAPAILLFIGALVIIKVGVLITSQHKIIEESRSDKNFQENSQSPGTDKVIKAANNYVCEKLGQVFCQKYVRNNSSSNSVAADKSVYYLVYQVSIPEKGITTNFQITQRNDFTKPKEIDILPNCNIVSKCDFLPKDKIQVIVQVGMNKYGIKYDQAKFSLKFEDYSPETPTRWLIYYSIPQEKTPQCKDFKMGGEVYMEVTALSGKVIKNEFNCLAPGI